MNTRKDFLAGLFLLLDARAIAYCVLRNYEDLAADGGTADLDLILEKRDLAAFTECLRTAAAAAGHRLAHSARYVNHSCVFWSGQSDFVRVDFETELRWRIFPVLPARAILESRRRCGNFFVPHPKHEAVVLFAQAVWTGKLSGRYRDRLARLHEACADKEELRRTYVEAFGGAGSELAEFHARVMEREFAAGLCARLKQSMVLKTVTRPPKWAVCVQNVAGDAWRLWERLRRPPGISLFYVSSLDQQDTLDGFMRSVEFLFPAAKCFVEQAGDRKSGFGWVRARTLFKGGMFIRLFRVAKDAELPQAGEVKAGGMYASRSFVCTEDSRRRLKMAHPQTRRQAGSGDGVETGETEFTTLLIGFIATVLEHGRAEQR